MLYYGYMKISRPILLIGVWFALSRTIFIAIAVIARSFIEQAALKGIFTDNALVTGVEELRKITLTLHPLQDWVFWDGWVYTNTATNGLTVANGVNVPQIFGFLPFYPFMQHLFGLVLFGKDYILSGFVLSNACLLLAVYVLYKIARFDFDQETSERAIKYFFLLPAAFLFSVVLSESLFMLVSLASVYFARRGNAWASSLLLAICCLTRPVGFLVIIPVLYSYYVAKGRSIKQLITWNTLSFFTIPTLAVVGYFSYLYYLTGDFFKYIHTQGHFFDHRLVEPFSYLINLLFNNNLSILVNVIYLFLCLLLLAAGIKRMNASYLIYTLCCLLFAPLTHGPLGYFRYSIICFPFILLLAHLSKNKDVDMFLSFGLVVLQAFLLIFWVNGFWFIN